MAATGAAVAGQPASVRVTFGDPQADDAPWAYSVSWGDGTAPTTGTAATQAPIDASHVYAAAGSFTVTADIEIVQSTELPWGGHYRGHAEAREFFTRLGARLDSTLALERFIDAGDQVVALGRTQGVTRQGGQSYDVPIAHVWTVRDGLLARAQFCIDNPTMLAALT